MANKTKRSNLVLLILLFLTMILSGCAKIYFYKVADEKVQYDFGDFNFYIDDLKLTIIKGKTIQYYEDSVYNVYDSRALRYKNMPFDSSKYDYLGLVNTIYSSEWTLVFETYLIADSIKIIPKPPFEFPEYDGLEQITVRTGPNSKDMWINPILVPKEYKDDFEIEYILSAYRESDNTLLVRKPIKLKVEYRSRGDSYFWGGR